MPRKGAFSPSASIVLTALLLVFIPAAAFAGSICGTITDADTGQPVEGAGIFARQTDGTYAGALAVSDAGGTWCIADLAAGTYTLEIRVDNYVTTFVNDVVVDSDVSGVPLTVARAAVTFDPPWPNPASSGVNLRLHVGRPTAMELGIYDARGRLVRSWTAASASVGTRDYFWDGRDTVGRPAPAGLYLVQVRSQGAQTSHPIVLTR
jgi:hypothetical protein